MSTDVLSPAVRGSLEAAQATFLELAMRLRRDLALHVEQLRREYGAECVERFLSAMGGQRLLDRLDGHLRCVYRPPRTSGDVVKDEGGGVLWDWEGGIEQMAADHAQAGFMCVREGDAA